MADAPSHVVDLATACVKSVKDTLQIPLDLEPETLPLLDHYAREIVGDEEHEVALGASLCGAYFGEVVRRRFGAVRWYAPEGIDPLANDLGADRFAEWRLEFEPAYLTFNPIGLALEVIEGKDAPGWRAHLQVEDRDREAVDAAVKLFGVERESDYYSFSVRFEVLEQVLEALAREAQRRGDEPARIGPEVYAARVK